MKNILFIASILFIVLFVFGCGNSNKPTIGACENAENCSLKRMGEFQVMEFSFPNLEIAGLWGNKAGKICIEELEGAVYGGEIGGWSCVNENEEGNLLILGSIDEVISGVSTAGWIDCRLVKILTPSYANLSDLEKKCSDLQPETQDD